MGGFIAISAFEMSLLTFAERFDNSGRDPSRTAHDPRDERVALGHGSECPGVTVPEVADLVRRALEARARAETLVRETAQRQELAELLREAHVGLRMVVRCAWCGSIQLGEEWLDLQAVTRSQGQILRSLRDWASHGICPLCFEAELRAADEHHPFVGAGAGARRP
jgi:hypothetical protein